MKFPSLTKVYHDALESYKRFPLALTSAIIASVIAVYLAGLLYSEAREMSYLNSIIMVLVLGIALFFALTLFSEKRSLSVNQKWSLRVAGIVFLFLYYLQLPPNPFEDLSKHLIRYFQLFLGLHLLVAFAPFTEKGEINGFWQFNKSIFLRFLTSILYSVVLYVGLIIAMISIDELLGITLPNDWYSQLWFIIIGIFNTWFFLSGIPENLAKLEHIQEYPKGLKIFTQYILLPLVILYMVILYLYAGKIIVEWNWPKGWVAILVLSFSISGIFALLLLDPIKKRSENRWIQTFSRYYYVILLPLVAMLLLAILRRISEYGITENRYFVLILGVWLGSISLYFIISKVKNIKVIPVSLCVITFLSSFGPWSAINISEVSQIDRLEYRLNKNNMLANETIRPPEDPVPFEDRKEISAIVYYLAETHSLEGIQPWFEKDLESLATTDSDSIYTYNRFQQNVNKQARQTVALMGIDYVDTWQTADLEYFYFNSAQPSTYNIGRFDWMIIPDLYGDRTDKFVILGNEYLIRVDRETKRLILSGPSESDSIIISLEDLIDQLVTEYGSGSTPDIPQDIMTLNQENEWIRIMLMIDTINLQREEFELKLNSINTRVFLTFKNQQD